MRETDVVVMSRVLPELVAELPSRDLGEEDGVVVVDDVDVPINSNTHK